VDLIRSLTSFDHGFSFVPLRVRAAIIYKSLGLPRNGNIPMTWVAKTVCLELYLWDG
jgi:hypothetical protein